MSDVSGCQLKINEMIGTLTPKERQLAKFTLENPERVVQMKIDDYANACNASISSVIRFCQKLGFAGYKEFIRSLCSDLAVASSGIAFDYISPEDDLATIVKNISAGNIKAIENTASINSLEEIDRAVDLLLNAGRIDFYGMGTSGFVAMDAASKFLRLQKTATAYQSYHSQVLASLGLKSADCAVIISFSGETRDILSLANTIKEQHVPIISITRYAKNKLSELADVRLFCCSTETMARSGAMTSRIAQLTVVDILYAAVCTRDFENIRPRLEHSVNAVKRLRSGK